MSELGAGLWLALSSTALSNCWVGVKLSSSSSESVCIPCARRRRFDGLRMRFGRDCGSDMTYSF